MARLPDGAPGEHRRRPPRSRETSGRPCRSPCPRPRCLAPWPRCRRPSSPSRSLVAVVVGARRRRPGREPAVGDVRVDRVAAGDVVPPLRRAAAIRRRRARSRLVHGPGTRRRWWCWRCSFAVAGLGFARVTAWLLLPLSIALVRTSRRPSERARTIRRWRRPWPPPAEAGSPPRELGRTAHGHAAEQHRERVHPDDRQREHRRERDGPAAVGSGAPDDDHGRDGDPDEQDARLRAAVVAQQRDPVAPHVGRDARTRRRRSRRSCPSAIASARHSRRTANHSRPTPGVTLVRSTKRPGPRPAEAEHDRRGERAGGSGRSGSPGSPAAPAPGATPATGARASTATAARSSVQPTWNTSRGTRPRSENSCANAGE